MAKPTSIPTWATDPGARIDPGPVRTASGFVPGKKLPAKWLNWILAQGGDWYKYLRDLHIEPEFLNKNYSWTGMQRFVQGYVAGNWGVRDEVIYVDDAGVAVAKTRTVRIPITSFVPDFVTDTVSGNLMPTWSLLLSPDTGGDTGWRHGGASWAGLSCEFALPQGAKFVRVTAQVQGSAGQAHLIAGAAYRTGGFWRQYYVDVDSGYPLNTTKQLVVNASDFLMDSAPSFNGDWKLWVRVTANATVALNWVEAQYTEPGPY